jgi:hypothetical protein
MVSNSTVDSLRHDPVAERLLRSTAPARFAYTWSDGTPRVVPIWFHWDGSAFVLGTMVRSPKLKVLADRPDVALTVDTSDFPYLALSVRGRAEVEVLEDVIPEYVAAAARYLGDEQGDAWISQLRGQPMARIRITPQWVNILDFETRLPSALSA